MDLGKQSALIRHLMDHHEGQGEVRLGTDAKAVLLALVGFNAVGHARSFRTLSQNIEHFLLEINGDYSAGDADHLRHFNRGHPHATAHIHDGHPRFDIGSEDLGRVVEQAAQAIVDEETAPPGANVRHGRSPGVD
jgi:hypothetical protein